LPRLFEGQTVCGIQYIFKINHTPVAALGKRDGTIMTCPRFSFQYWKKAFSQSKTQRFPRRVLNQTRMTFRQSLLLADS